MIFQIDNRQCFLYTQENPCCLLLQPMDTREINETNAEWNELTQAISFPFCFSGFSVDDWNQELSPWDAPPVFGHCSFGHGAAETLSFLENSLLPLIEERSHSSRHIPVILGGYSLAGFFSLWSTYQTDRFSAVSAVSPSVWFPGWLDYAKSHSIKTNAVYLSLGDREEKTKNKTMATVGKAIQEQLTLLESISSILEWNPGNHFQDVVKRCVKGFAWCADHIKS